MREKRTFGILARSPPSLIDLTRAKTLSLAARQRGATWCNRRRISRSICRDRVNLVPCARAHCLPYTLPPACRPACLPASLSTCLFIHTKQAYCVLWLFPIWNYRNAFRDAATSQCCVASTSRASLAVASFPVFWEQLCTAGLWKSICVIM